jgi:DNA repair protein RAD50
MHALFGALHLSVAVAWTDLDACSVLKTCGAQASVEKLSIRGIRAFSPERDEVIEFYKPLTMIVGRNGCGKTTIIECLKYSCTGILPPGAQMGKTFVHDPKISQKTETKASIKLKFVNQANQHMVIQRSMQLIQKKGSLTFKGLDGVIRQRNAAGEQVSMGHKCTELDKVVPNLMGVSKAILENVIFCHQEESNWPLQEGSVLKKKFDDIFESTRYSKALETIRKTKLAKQNAVKDLKLELAVLNTTMKHANDIRDEATVFEERLAEISDLVKHGDAKIAELQKRVAEISKEYEERQMLDIRASTQGTALQGKEERAEQLVSSIEIPLEGTDEELQELLAQYDNTLESNADTLAQKEESKRGYQEIFAESQQKENQLCTQRGQLQAEAEQQEALIANLVQNTADCREQFKLKQFGSPVPEAEMENFTDAVRAYEKNARETYDAFGKKSVSDGDKLAAKVSEAQATVNQLAKAIEANTKKRSTMDAESITVTSEHDKNARQHISSAVDMKDIDAQLTKAETELKEFRDKGSAGDIRTAISGLVREKGILDMDLDRLKRVINDLQEHESKEQSLGAQEKDLRRREEALTAEIQRKSQVLQAALGFVPAWDAVQEASADCEAREARAQATMDESERSVRDARESLQSCKSKLEHAERRQEEFESRAMEHEAELADARGVIARLFPGEGKGLESFDAALEKANANMQKFIDKKNFITNATGFLQRYEAKGVANKECPLCTTKFTSDNMVEHFKTNVKGKYEGPEFNSKLQKAEQKLKQIKEGEVDVLEASRHAYMLYMQDKENLPACEATLNEVRPQVQEQEQEVEELERSKEEKATVHRECAAASQFLASARDRLVDLRNDRANWDEDQKELADAQGAGRSLHQTRTERDSVQSKIDETTEKITSKQTENQTHMDRMQTLQSKKDRLTDRKATLEKKVERQTELQTRMQELKAGMEELTIKLRQDNRDKTQWQGTLQALQGEQQNKRSAWDRENVSKREAMFAVTQRSQGFLALRAQVRDSLGTSDKKEDIRELEAELEELRLAQQEATRQIEELEPDITACVRRADEAKSMLRAVKDNVAHREMLRDCDRERAELDKLTEEMRAMPSTQDILQQHTASNKKLSAQRERKAAKAGQEKEVADQLKAKRLQLQTGEYKGVEVNQRKKLVEYETTGMAVSDLDKYYQALDKALMKYHTMKIMEINAIIRELWTLTYRGEDIDCIEIHSGIDGQGSKSARSYNYHINMRKGDAELDMRGRCSAGQKVLAGLVIRLALAETFCVNCGILALDEVGVVGWRVMPSCRGLAHTNAPSTPPAYDEPGHEQQAGAGAGHLADHQLARAAAELPAHVHHARRGVRADARHGAHGLVGAQLLLAHLARGAHAQQLGQ